MYLRRCLGSPWWTRRLTRRLHARAHAWTSITTAWTVPLDNWRSASSNIVVIWSCFRLFCFFWRFIIDVVLDIKPVYLTLIFDLNKLYFCMTLHTPYFNCFIVTAGDKYVRLRLSTVNKVYHVAMAVLSLTLYTTTCNSVKKLTRLALPNVNRCVFSDIFLTPKYEGMIYPCKTGS